MQALLRPKGVEDAAVSWYVRTGDKLIDQVGRRLIQGEQIPHGDKLFSVHEPHTRWISKGNSGVLEDQHPFILHPHVQRGGGDQGMIVDFLAEAKRHDPSLVSCSMDKGFYTPAVWHLDTRLNLNVVPKKGRLRAADRLRETHPDCVAARRHASSGEIGDQSFESPGPVPGAHGKEGFDRTVGRVVVAANVHRLGQILKQQEARRRQWH